MKTPENSFVQVSPDRLEIKKGGGCLSLFGIPFFAAGIFILLISLHLIPISNANEIQWWGWIVLAFMGIVFTCVGAVLVFGREWYSIDRAQQRIWIARGLLVPMRGSSYSLNDYDSILLKYDAGDSETAEKYPISLSSTQEGKELLLINAMAYGAAREQAMMLMKFLCLPLSDLTTDHAEFLSVHPKPASEFDDAKESIPVPQLSCRVIENSEELSLALKGEALHPIHIISGLIPALLFIIFGLRFFRFMVQTQTPVVVRLFFWGFFGVFFVLLPLSQVLNKLLLTRVYTYIMRINIRGVEFETRSLFSRKTILIKPQDVLGFDFSIPETWQQNLRNPSILSGTNRDQSQNEVHRIPGWVMSLAKLNRSKGIIIKASEGLHYFGSGLPSAEIRYLHFLVVRAFNRFHPQFKGE